MNDHPKQATLSGHYVNEIYPVVRVSVPPRPNSNEPVLTYTALVDTGSDSTLVTPKFIHEARLASHRTGDIIGSTGRGSARYFRTHLCFDMKVPGFDHRVGMGIDRPYPFTITDVEVAEMPPHPYFDALIGNDLLREFDIFLPRGRQMGFSLSLPI